MTIEILYIEMDGERNDKGEYEKNEGLTRLSFVEYVEGGETHCLSYYTGDTIPVEVKQAVHDAIMEFAPEPTEYVHEDLAPGTFNIIHYFETYGATELSYVEWYTVAKLPLTKYDNVIWATGAPNEEGKCIPRYVYETLAKAALA